MTNDSNDSLELLESLLDRLKLANEAHKYGDALAAAAQALDSLSPRIEALERWHSSVRLLHGNWEPEERKAALEALQAVRERATYIENVQDREQLSRVRFITQEIGPRLDNAFAHGRRAWHLRLADDTGSLVSLESLLVEFPDTRELGLRIRNATAIANALRQEFPPSPSRLEQHRILQEQVARIKQDLAAVGAGESVQRFLLALADGTATLDMLDDATLRWIRERGAQSRIALSLRLAGA